MPSGCGGRLRRLLAGLLVLSVIFMAFAQVNALTVPGISVLAAPNQVHQHDATASSAEHDHADHPCKGHKRSPGVACCLSGGCPLLAVALPTTAPIPPPVTPITVSNPRLAVAQPDGIGRAPDLPPPRHIV